MSFVMLWEVSVQVFGRHQLQHCISQEFKPLIRAEREIIEADAAVGEGAGQQADVLEFHTNGILKFGEFLRNRKFE